MNREGIIFGFAIFALITGIFLFVLMVCQSLSEVNVETSVINVTNSDIVIRNDDFYIEGPNGKMVKLDISGGKVLDLTKHSDILIKFKRYPPVGIYRGRDWFVDGIVKTQ